MLYKKVFSLYIFFSVVRGVRGVRGALKVFNYSLLTTRYSLIKGFPFSVLPPLSRRNHFRGVRGVRGVRGARKAN